MFIYISKAKRTEQNVTDIHDENSLQTMNRKEISQLDKKHLSNTYS